MQWRALRIWAAEKRDDRHNSMGVRDSAAHLCYLLDSIENSQADNLKGILSLRALQVMESILVRCSIPLKQGEVGH